MNATINLPIDIAHDDKTGFTYCVGSPLESSLYAPSLAISKSKMRVLIAQEIHDALVEQDNYQRKIIACKGGEVLIVHFRNGQWGYDIAGPDRSGCCSCWGSKTFQEAIDSAVQHSEQSYGGVLWQC